MLELLIVLLIVLWLTGAVGWRGRRWGTSRGNLVHILLVLAVILLLFRLLR
ncbi:MAG: lmo0937 family membrane protein [Chloroflexota bacterium]